VAGDRLTGDHPLVRAQLARLDRRLPHDLADEVADGLRSTYERHLRAGAHHDSGGRADAAAAAIAEFGDADVVADAFLAASPGRLTARALLATGPLVGGCWAAVLVSDRAWTWPVPDLGRSAAGAALLLVVAALLLVLRAPIGYRALHAVTATACGLLVLLDLALPLTAVTRSPSPTPLLVLAAGLSAVRLAVVAARGRAVLAAALTGWGGPRP